MSGDISKKERERNMQERFSGSGEGLMQDAGEDE